MPAVRPEVRWAETPDEGAQRERPIDWLITDEWDGVPYLSVGRAAEGYVLRSHGLGDFWVTEDGSRVEVVPNAETPRAQLTEVLEQQVLPVVFQLSGAPALHASAVSTENGVIGFVGPSGAGKSTIAAVLSRRWHLVADDYLPMKLEADRVLAVPSSAWVRLREAAVNQLGERGFPRAGKTAVLREAEREPGNLVRIYALGSRDADAISIEPMSGKDAYLALASQLHRMSPNDPSLLAAELDFLDAVIARVPIRRLAYPRSFEAFAEVERAVAGDVGLSLTPGRSP